MTLDLDFINKDGRQRRMSCRASLIVPTFLRELAETFLGAGYHCELVKERAARQVCSASAMAEADTATPAGRTESKISFKNARQQKLVGILFDTGTQVSLVTFAPWCM